MPSTSTELTVRAKTGYNLRTYLSTLLGFTKGDAELWRKAVVGITAAPGIANRTRSRTLPSDTQFEPCELKSFRVLLPAEEGDDPDGNTVEAILSWSPTASLTGMPGNDAWHPQVGVAAIGSQDRAITVAPRAYLSLWRRQETTTHAKATSGQLHLQAGYVPDRGAFL